MKNFFSYLLLSLCLALIQGWLSFKNITPNLALVAVITSAILGGFFYGLIIGFICGILIDCLSLSQTGLHILYLTIIGSMTGYLTKYFYWKKIKVIICVIFLMSLMYGAFNIISLSLESSRFYSSKNFMDIVIPESIYNTILSPFIYLMFYYTKSEL
jgi:rod shape-determining protein MreD